jgi:hypothetical protein
MKAMAAAMMRNNDMEPPPELLQVMSFYQFMDGIAVI